MDLTPLFLRPGTGVAPLKAVSWVCCVAWLVCVGCDEPIPIPDGGLQLRDVGVADVRVPMAISAAADTMDAAEDSPTGTFGHCCVEGVLASCYCPAGVTCHFGIDCGGGICLDGDGGACPSTRDAQSD